MPKEQFAGLIERKYSRVETLDKKYRLTSSLGIDGVDRALSIRSLTYNLEKNHVAQVDELLYSPQGLIFRDQPAIIITAYRNERRKSMLEKIDADIAMFKIKNYTDSSMHAEVIEEAMGDIGTYGVHKDVNGCNFYPAAIKEIVFMEGWFAPEKVLVDAWSRDWKPRIASF